MIDGVLNNDRTRYVREYIKRNAWVKGIISLAPATFESYGARAKTSILFLQRKLQPDDGEQKPVFMAVAQNTGYAPNGSQVPGNELPDILLAYKTFLTGSTSFNHANSFVTSVGDRLDAERYWRRPGGKRYDLPSLQRDVSGLLASIRSEYAKIEKEIEAAFRQEEMRIVPLRDLLEEYDERERIDRRKTYKLLGVRWWGEGAFIREQKLGEDIRATGLHRVSSGTLVYNRLFAFRGSFAVLEEEHDGCYVFSEFPTFAVREGVANSAILCKYIVYCLNSPQYLDLVDALSTGSTKTSRNRLRQNQFLSIDVRIPDSDSQLRAIVTLMDRAYALRAKQHTLLDRVKDLREGISALLPPPGEYQEPVSEPIKTRKPKARRKQNQASEREAPSPKKGRKKAKQGPAKSKGKLSSQAKKPK